MFQRDIDTAATGQLLIFGHQECLAAREKNKCSLSLKSEPSPSISSRIRATFVEKPFLLSCSGPLRQVLSLGECRRYIGETTLEQEDRGGRANPACQFSLIVRLQEQLRLLLTLLWRARLLTKMYIFSKCAAFLLLFLLPCLICSHGGMIFLFFSLQHLP